MEVPGIREAAIAARRRPADEAAADRSELEGIVALLSADRAG